jgi:hypothetical protein
MQKKYLEIKISEPTFKCKTDEEVFFQRIGEINGVQKVIRRGVRLYVTVFDSDKSIVLRQVQKVCDFWHTTFYIKTL